VSGDQPEHHADRPADQHRSHAAVHGPIDPDVDLHDAAQRDELHHHHPKLLGTIAVGGVIGAEARYGLAEALPHGAGAFPWATLVTNLLGCLSIGLLMGWLAARPGRPQLARPFLGVGILGGFTTFSTYALDLHDLLAHHHAGTAAAYLLLTLAGGVAAVVVGLRLTEDRQSEPSATQVQV
jgi:CrcB protein